MRTLDELREHFPLIDFNEEYIKVLSLLEKNDTHLNIIGEAGSGKTTLLGIIKYALSNYTVITCATTGVASALLNNDNPDIKATTLHSVFKIKPQDIYGQGLGSTEKVDSNTSTIIEKMDYLIIDECSMLSASLFDYLIAKIEYVRRKAGIRELPKIILFGDIMQLPPVIKDQPEIIKYYEDLYNGNYYYFNSNKFNDYNFETICLKQNYRQSEDTQFRSILNRIRVGKVTDEDLVILNSHVVDDCEWLADHENSLRICTTVKNVEIHNRVALDMFDTPPISFYPKIIGDFRLSPEYKSGNYPDVLTLKVGVPVMITRNDLSESHEYVNGDMGTLIECDIDNRKVVVKLANSDKIVCVPDFTTETYDYEVGRNNSGTITVTPHCTGAYTNIAVKVCASATIHKTQGLTISGFGLFDKGKPNGWIPESGMYVALSRFKELNHLGLVYPINKKDIKVNKEALAFLRKLGLE